MANKSGKAALSEARSMVEEISQLTQVPGALEMLMTVAAEELGGAKSEKVKKLRLYNMGEGGAATGYAQGGLGQIMAQQAEEVRQEGRNDDSMMLHVSPEEFEAITSMWGPPDINPNTGIPEYGFLSKLWKGIKKTVKKIVKSPLFSFIAPIALNVFAPGLGSAIGGWLGATGKAAATIGNTLLRTGIGAISGGKEGAISGALSGLTSAGVGADIGKKIGLEGATARVVGDAVLGGVAGEATGVGFQQGALGSAMSSIAGRPMQKFQDRLTEWGQSKFDPLTTIGMTNEQLGGVGPTVEAAKEQFGDIGMGDSVLPQELQVDLGAQLDDIAALTQPPQEGYYLAGTPEVRDMTPVQTPSLIDRGVDWVKENPILAGAGALGLMYATSPDDPGGPGGGGPLPLPEGWDSPLPNVSFDRQLMPIENYYSYGRASSPGGGGEQLFFGDNRIPQGDFPGGIPGETPPGPGGGPGGPWEAHPLSGRRIMGMQIPEFNWNPATGQRQPLSQTQTPFQVQGPYDLIRVQQLVQNHGWTYDEQNKTAYPPGSFGAAEGGFVDMPQKPYSMQMQFYKLGGLVKKYQAGGQVSGRGTGRSDEIPAVLSDGEFVIDAETVALLGDGSTDAGAERLEEMRQNLRKHKGGGLAKGKFSADAKTPEQYMKRGGKAKKKKATNLAGIRALAEKLDRAISSGNKKRVAEITAQLNTESPGIGEKIAKEYSRGGNVKRMLKSLERTVDDPDVQGDHVTGPRERRFKNRRRREREESGGQRGRRLTDREAADLAEELGGFTQDSAFIRRFRRQLQEAAETE